MMGRIGRKRTAAGAAAMELRTERNTMIGPKMNFAAAEAYKLLRTNLMFSFSKSERCRVVGVTSSFHSEGKSLTSMNLAYTIAEVGQRVLLVEGDMRLPTIAGRLRLTSKPGLSNLLVNLNSVSETIQTFASITQSGDEVDVSVLVSGDIPPNPSELLGSARMQSLLEALRERFDYIVLDLPPVTAVSDAVIASKLVDGMVVVVRRDHAVRRSLAETIRQLKLVDTRILGFVFNGASESGGGYYKGKYYRKNYYYKNYYYKQ